MKVSADRRKVAEERLEWWRQQVAASARRFVQVEGWLSTCESGSGREMTLLEERKRILEETYEARCGARDVYELLCAWTRAEED